MSFLGLIIVLGEGLALAWCLLLVVTARTLSRPPRRGEGYAVARSLPLDPTDAARALGVERPVAFSQWTFASSAGQSLPVWDIIAHRPDGPTLIFTHGWGESRHTSLARLAAWLPCCSRVVMWDLPGHADTARGASFRLGTREVDDLRRLIDVVAGERRDAPSGVPIVLHGYSLGAGISIAAAVDDPRVVGVIAEAPYRLPTTPARNVLRSRAMPHRSNLVPSLAALGLTWGLGTRWLRADGPFDRAAWATRLSQPLLVIVGSRDEICPPEESRAIAQAAPRGRLVMIDGAAHTDVWSTPSFAEHAARTIDELIGSTGVAR